jgi:hypothetical protein
MKIIFLAVGILCLTFAQNISAEKVIKCTYNLEFDDEPACVFSNVTIEKNEAVSINTDPEDLDATTIMHV